MCDTYRSRKNLKKNLFGIHKKFEVKINNYKLLSLSNN